MSAHDRLTFHLICSSKGGSTFGGTGTASGFGQSTAQPASGTSIFGQPQQQTSTAFGKTGLFEFKGSFTDVSFQVQLQSLPYLVNPTSQQEQPLVSALACSAISNRLSQRNLQQASSEQLQVQVPVYLVNHLSSNSPHNKQVAVSIHHFTWVHS